MSSNIKKIAILGSTGSIGQQTLDIVRNFPEKFRVVGLAGGENSSLFAKQINEFNPQFVYVKKKIAIPQGIIPLSMEEIARHPDVELVIIATSGKAGLFPTLAAIKAGKKVALANKEALVMAGKIITADVKRYHAKLLPIDSEHSAIWQCIQGEKTAIARIILTASGGPFHKYSLKQLAKVTVEEAMQHPTWKMGKKVTIDSATLMNKGLEAIEAHLLFSTPLSKIDIMIHRKSIVHSLVEFVDGTMKAQLSLPDMRFPIQYALSYPKRLSNNNLPFLDLVKTNSLEFEPVNYETYPCLTLALEAGKRGGTYPAVLCAADDIAVDLFLTKRIKLTNIADLITETINLHQSISKPDLDEIIAADEWTRRTVVKIAQKGKLCY